jgi:hypothetical protein
MMVANFKKTIRLLQRLVSPSPFFNPSFSIRRLLPCRKTRKGFKQPTNEFHSAPHPRMLFLPPPNVSSRNLNPQRFTGGFNGWIREVDEDTSFPLRYGYVGCSILEAKGDCRALCEKMQRIGGIRIRMGASGKEGGKPRLGSFCG